MDWDALGHCTLCHRYLMIEQVIDNKVMRRFTPDYAETEFLLDDGSKMRVAICVTCKETLKDKDQDKIMEAVVKGWAREVESYDHWSAEKKRNHMDVYSKKKIVIRSENKSPELIEKTLKEFKEKKNARK